MSAPVTYFVGQVPQTFARRIFSTKTFWTASSLALGVAAKSVELAVAGTIGWKAAVTTILVSGVGGSLVVCLRDAAAKAELAAHAANQSLPGVSAVPTPGN